MTCLYHHQPNFKSLQFSWLDHIIISNTTMAIYVIIVVVIIVAFYNPIVLRTILVEKAEIPVA